MIAPSRFIDIHSHFLPGIDDGAETVAESLDILRWLAGQGVTDVIATPHFVNETNYVSTRAHNQKLLKEMQEHLAEEGLAINIYLGNEIYIDGKILDLFKERKITTLAGSVYLLVELPLNDEFPNYEDHLLDLMNRGFKVVLAHPERYGIFQKDYEKAQRLREAGILFQCNLGSIIGKYGKNAQKLIKKFAKDKMIFAFGSDVHHSGRKEYFALVRKKLSKYYSEAELRQILVTNPNRIINR